jgi:hypothetical protein
MSRMTPDVSKIVDYEEGLLDEVEIIELFQSLVDSGMAWRLQGSYGRTAQDLIDAGLVAERDPENVIHEIMMNAEIKE